ncbi:MAG: VWA domain-containing protein [Immundisolibacteraceae bacterium]|nr:VWA domain-containing protein [Immundisolibacteraceae bacterium]
MMKSKLLLLSVFIVTGTVIGFYPLVPNVQANLGQMTHIDLKLPAEQQMIDQGGLLARPKIQLAILLDTSSSMNGLLDQARNQLWQVVNEFSESTQNGIKPLLEVAVYEYGNSGLARTNGFTRQLTGLTQELDSVSEALFSLTTNGGDEYCGYVINSAVSELSWSSRDGDIKAIFIAGNEPFTQGPVAFKTAMVSAREKGITVSTIHAGNYQQGVSNGWQQAALLAGGDYMSIDHNIKVAHLVAPQDKKIAELNSKLNQTYIPYGKDGQKKADRQRTQDSLSAGISAGLMAKRVRAKISQMYQSSSWDLVDAMEDGSIALDSIEEAELPAAMQDMDAAERTDYVAGKLKARQEIKQEIRNLSEKRGVYVAEQEALLPAAAPSVSSALSQSIRNQGESKNYVFQ